MEVLVQDIGCFLKRLHTHTKEFEEKFMEQCNDSDFLRSGVGSIYKVLQSASTFLEIIQKKGSSGSANLVPVYNIVAIISVVLTGVKYVAVALSMLEADKGYFDANQAHVQHCIERLKKRFDVIENRVDDMSGLVEVMLVLHQESAHSELENAIILLKEKLRETKSDLDSCTRVLQEAKVAIDGSINKLNFRIPLAATATGVLGAAGLGGLGVAGFLLVPFGGIGIPILVAAGLGAVSLGGATIVGTSAVKLAVARNKFLVYKQQQELLCRDIEELTGKVQEHANMLQKSGIDVENPWEIEVNWSLQMDYECFTSSSGPSVGR